VQLINCVVYAVSAWAIWLVSVLRLCALDTTRRIDGDAQRV